MPFGNVNWGDVVPNEGGETKRLEPGGYVACVVNVEDVTDNTGSYLNVDFDIAEGPFEGYYREWFERSGNWNGHIRLYYKYTIKRGPKAGQTEENYGRVKAWLTAIEKSNGITIDYGRIGDGKKLFQALVDQRKLFGVLLGYDQREHKYINAYQTRSADVIRSGDYTIPDEWKVRHDDYNGNAVQYGGYGGGGQSAPPPDDPDDGLPF